MSKIEIVREIFTVVSILIKFNSEDVLEHKREHFIAFINELGLRTETGKEFNVVNFKKLMTDLSVDDKNLLIEEFNSGYRDLYQYLEMYTNR